ncbi:MAG: transglutaminase domain-containing protein [Bryobacterales bacterium]|nr:transglutaminase domain-containing protein [Bryobacterales bacterium]
MREQQQLIPPTPCHANAGAFLHPRFGRRLVTMQTAARPADDETATAQTIGVMAALVREDARSPIVRQAAMQSIAELGSRDERKEIASVFKWVKRHVRYRADAELAQDTPAQDPDTTEVLIRPVDLLTMPEPTGDCDDFAMLTAALLRALGIRANFVTIAADEEDPTRYSHVFLEAITSSGERIALDTSHGPRPGWQAPAVGKSKTWSIDQPMQQSTLGATEPAWWQTLVNTGVNTASGILSARYGHAPQGTYIQDGDKLYYRPTDSQAGPLSFPTSQISDPSGWIVIGLIGFGLGLVLILKGRQ